MAGRARGSWCGRSGEDPQKRVPKAFARGSGWEGPGTGTPLHSRAVRPRPGTTAGWPGQPAGQREAPHKEKACGYRGRRVRGTKARSGVGWTQSPTPSQGSSPANRRWGAGHVHGTPRWPVVCPGYRLWGARTTAVPTMGKGSPAAPCPRLAIRQRQALGQGFSVSATGQRGGRIPADLMGPPSPLHSLCSLRVT